MSVSVFTAACGDYPMAATYVANLYQGFIRNLVHGVYFHVVSDIPEVHDLADRAQGAGNWLIAHEPQRSVWGWWHLLELYRPDAPWSDDTVIMAGLDTVIRGSLDWAICAAPTFMRPVREGLGLSGAFDGAYANGLVCLPPQQHYTKVWNHYLKTVDVKKTWQGRRRYPEHVWVTHAIKSLYPPAQQPEFWQDKCPGKLCSYREPTPKLEEPKEPLVIFHGHPRPHEAVVDAPWIPKYWKSAAET